MSNHRRRGRAARSAARALLAIPVCTLLAVRARADEETEHMPRSGSVTVVGAQITLDASARAAAGIATVAAVPVAGRADVAAFGRVVDPLPLVEALHARASTRATVTAAAAEAKRVARLHVDDQNASTRDLEAAEAALQRTQGDAADAAARLALAWGKAAELDQAVIEALIAHQAALVRIDLPSGVHLASAPTQALLLPVGSSTTALEASILGVAPTTDPMLQGDAYLALVSHAAPRPGTALDVTLPRATAQAGAVAVPASAVVWLDAEPVVYVETSPGSFVARPVTLGPEANATRQIDAGVAAGEQVVREGAAQLVSAHVLSAAPSE
jgi:hypothetical protein